MAARKSMISVDFSAFSDYAERLDKLGGDLKTIFADAMEQAAETVEYDTVDAVASSNMPAGGKYSQGDTEASIIHDAKVEWSGSVAEIGLGFDKTKSGAGGFLITGTPKMRPNYALEKIYGTKKYENQLKRDIEDVLKDEIEQRLGG
jgi:hypothetical protein